MLRTEVHADPRDFWTLMEPWRQLWDHSGDRVPFLHPLWMQAWWTRYRGDGRLCLVSAWENGDHLVGMAPLCRRASSSGPLEWLGGTDLADALDFLVWKGMEGPVLGALERGLRPLAEDAGELDFHFIPEDSPTLTEANGMLANGWDVDVTLEEVSPWVLLPGSWEAFLQGLSGKERHELRRKMRKAERELNPAFRMIEDERSWKEGIGTFIRLHKLSQPEKALFMDPEREGFFDDMGLAFLREGSLRLTWLEANGEPIASAISFVYGATWGLYNSGFDPRYREFSPGIVLVAHTIQRAIEEGLRTYDFLRGPEPYKYDFGARDRDLFRLRLFPRSGWDGR